MKNLNTGCRFSSQINIFIILCFSYKTELVNYATFKNGIGSIYSQKGRGIGENVRPKSMGNSVVKKINCARMAENFLPVQFLRLEEESRRSRPLHLTIFQSFRYYNGILWAIRCQNSLVCFFV